MATAEQLLIQLDATSESLRRELKKADQTVGDFAKKTDRHMRNVDSAMDRVNRASGLMTKGLGALGVALSIGAITNFAKANIGAADNLVKTADALGLTIEGLQEYRFGAARSGVATSELDKALEQWVRRLGQAQAGTGNLLPVLAQYNVTLRENDGRLRATEAVLGDYADALAGAASPQEKLRLATEAFGRSGGSMVNLLKGGSSGLADFANQANDAGVVLGGDLARRAEELNDRLGILSERADVAAQTFVLSMAPAIEATIGVFERLSIAVAGAMGGLSPQQFVFGDELDAAREQAAALRVELEALEEQDGRSATRQSSGHRIKIEALEAVDAYAALARIQDEIAEKQAKIDATGRARGKPGRNTGAAESIADLEKQAAAIQVIIDRSERAATVASDVITATSAAVNDNFADVETQLLRAREAFDTLAAGGVKAFDEINSRFDLDQKAAAAAEAFNRANSKLIESGQLQARTAADYRDTLQEIADLQTDTASLQALDKYTASLDEQYQIAKLRLQVGEDEARIQVEINRLRAMGVALSDDEEAAIRRTAAATQKLNQQFDDQQEALKKVEKAAEDAAMSFNTIPNEYAEEFATMVEEVFACPS